MLRYVPVRPQLTARGRIARTARCFASRNGGEQDEAELAAARNWLANLDAETIRKNADCDISFSRSSGPGGQNVNK
jgi:peptidyl-tRNA hydrolase ICT1